MSSFSSSSVQPQASSHVVPARRVCPRVFRPHRNAVAAARRGHRPGVPSCSCGPRSSWPSWLCLHGVVAGPFVELVRAEPTAIVAARAAAVALIRAPSARHAILKRHSGVPERVGGWYDEMVENRSHTN